MRRYLLNSVFIAVALGLSACATQPQKQTSAKKTAVWEIRQQQLSELNHWTFNGRVAVRDEHAEGWNASLSWRQLDQNYDIRLSGTLGQGGVRLHGDNNQAVIEAADQTPQSAASPEALMHAQLGWHVPVEGMKYWLMGRPKPQPGTDDYSETLDHLGRLSHLQQDGWNITYKRYARINGVELPRKLELKNQHLRVRLVIDSWRLHNDV